MKNFTSVPLSRLKKKPYKKPTLAKLGNLSALTLKTGSVSDFGSNQFQP